MTKVSVIITTHNRSSFIKRAVDSAKSSGKDVEVIVVDDASTDQTEEICSFLEGIKYIRIERNQRTAGARNVGLVASQSPFVTFLDDDDWRLPGSIDKQLEVFHKNPDYGLVYGQYIQADQDGNITDDKPIPLVCPQGDVFWNLLNENIVGCLTAVFRKECIYTVGLLDTSPDMVGIEDYDLWVRIAELFPFGAINAPVAIYRKPAADSQQWSSNVSRQYFSIAKAYKSKWAKLPRAVKENSNKSKFMRNQLLNSVSDHILYDMSHNSKGIKEKINKIFTALRCYPFKATQKNFYKTIIKGFFSN